MTSLLVTLLAAVTAAGVSAQAGSTWLDRPMASWNEIAKSIPSTRPGTEPQSALERRCGSTTLATSKPAAAIRAAGWVPFLHFDQAISRNDVEVVGGMNAASPGCEPTRFNLFVFVGGMLAGTISPETMTQNRDGVAGSVRITADDTLIAEFARYTASDSECCPSSRVRVSYRIERGGSRPVLVATDVRRVR
jgi:LppP/LprE lipoprotein